MKIVAPADLYVAATDPGFCVSKDEVVDLDAELAELLLAQGWTLPAATPTTKAAKAAATDPDTDPTVSEENAR